jgi:prolyl oligopeptidase
MTGYGSYGNSMKPYFSPYSLLWVQDGGILVYTHVRGGGEKGLDWHKGGYKETKPNTWKDFISSAEYLIDNKFTAPKYIGISGGSAGGILIGRAITERPDLFKAAVIDVGVLNTIRFELTPNGQNNVKEFGSVQTEKEFNALLEMDAYHHIKKGVNYPATLITTGMNDARVIAWIPAKFAAKLKANTLGKNPVLLGVDFNGGHIGNDAKNSIFSSMADEFAFFYWQLGDKRYQIK